jgi:hypothetical protein
MGWEVEYTDEFGSWWSGLDNDDQDAIIAAVDVLEERGPGLGRPLIDTVHASRHPNMKELRPPAGYIRILFAFDPRRAAILLIGGDKTNRWRAWYEQMVPVADRLYDEHLATLEKEDNRQ